jgi:hypothetical protein
MKWAIRIVSILAVLAVLFTGAGAVNIEAAIAGGEPIGVVADAFLGAFILDLFVVVPLSLVAVILGIVDASRSGRVAWIITLLIFAPILEILGGYALSLLTGIEPTDAKSVIAASLFWFAPLIVPMAALVYSFWSAPRKPHLDQPPADTGVPE